ncbi:hypothetical protein A2U01_0045329 [Trifolium medium]|uniref:Uncharacterized protein n=1 Tax=Trifolium medium TaxID=97028 RepID=A0A392QKS7_9FABA|nr:hypothetical protein [Trifolium medium]
MRLDGGLGIVLVYPGGKRLCSPFFIFVIAAS